MGGHFTHQLQRVFCIAAVTAWLAIGWPVLQAIASDGTIRGGAVPFIWLVPFTLFGSAIVLAMVARLPTRLLWFVLGVELVCVVAMAVVLPWAGISQFLIVIAWQAATATRPTRAVGWVVFQTLAVVVVLAQALNPDLCWVIGKSVALQLLLVFTAFALRREAATARALERTNADLRTAQAVIAAGARDAERLRISRELHDAWGHELTALSLQLEIASHVPDVPTARDHVAQARSLSRALLAKVRDVVATLRESEQGDLAQMLAGFARSVPVPAVHVHVAPGIAVNPDQAHALVRCAQEAVTNAVKHAQAANLWLSVDADDAGIRLIASDDGHAAGTATGSGTGLRGMRERMEQLGGRLAIRAGIGHGFTVEAWLPSGMSRAT